jgi:hypothetical protein
MSTPTSLTVPGPGLNGGINVLVEGLAPHHQTIYISGGAVSLENFFRLAEFVLLAGDLGDETDPRRKFQQNVRELQFGEGRRVGSQRFRPSHDRLRAGTVSPVG